MAQTVSGLIAAYLASVPAKSRRPYRRVLDMWIRWCADNAIDMMHVRRSHIDAWKIWRVEHMGVSPATLAAELTPICCFYEYLWQEGYLERNPAEHVKRPTQRRWSDGSWLSEEQASKFLALAEADRRTWVGAACALLLLNGLRRNEVLGLDIADYHRVDGRPTLHVKRKFDWMQEVGLADRTAADVERAIGKRATGPLLLYRGKRLQSQTLAATIADLGKQSGADRRITPHSLRRTFATTARRHGVPDREIMASGAWSSREMIDRYDMGRLAVTNAASTAVSAALTNTDPTERTSQE
ncbi:tyrosine-type recombinase/integrase [Bifidobacterium vansinderenii]|uniref:Phage integrase family n=1 Tax=Bifidobacterium vansinderenii TaxID=1984871 RepID=A0A229VY10_9BIFI|nr:site-specific integrase [Bifidobacterium vansinderenii]OXN00513.1 Phage integrase family [Bifidobacterium vansinderenii]